MRNYLISVFLFFPILIFSQNIKITFIDKFDKKPINGLQIFSDNGSLIGNSNIQGEFKFDKSILKEAGVKNLMIYDDNLFIDTINLLVCSANFAFTIVLVIIGVFLALLDSLGVTVETDFIVNFILFLLAQSRLFILCRIFVSLYNSYLSNKLREYLLSVNFYILLVFLCICW